MNFKKWFSGIIKTLDTKNLKNKNKGVNLLIIFLIGVLMIITVSFFKTPDSNKAQTTNSNNSSSSKSTASNETQDKSDSSDYEKSVEAKLKDTLEKIDGVGKVDVMISFESGEEQVPAVNINDSKNTTQEKDTSGGTRNTVQDNNGSTVVTTNDGDKSKPLILKTYKPKVSGVCIVAEGAENEITELRISKAVMDLFNITEDKINVYPMKK
ncbi:stage III sporulation protein AG [Clostridium algifaecis]|uniref:Stage III sporulation protein AG n=1 Tax=Clostridium algifaecis TaxID=1472040 RepID=A0ABS4KN55_9CLOT|nr:stage III sporulation protein AG [Clostridium algifaecis]MBP2031473.1 stage III sporulation protein AG [Clostridium algifaecis]